LKTIEFSKGTPYRTQFAAMDHTEFTVDDWKEIADIIEKTPFPPPTNTVRRMIAIAAPEVQVISANWPDGILQALFFQLAIHLWNEARTILPVLRASAQFLEQIERADAALMQLQRKAKKEPAE